MTIWKKENSINEGKYMPKNIVGKNLSTAADDGSHVLRDR